MNKAEWNIKTAEAIYANMMARFVNGDDVTINNYHANDNVKAIVRDKFGDNLAHLVGFPKPAREVPADIEARLRGMAKAGEEKRYEYMRTA